MTVASVSDRAGRVLSKQTYAYDLCERLTLVQDYWGPDQGQGRRLEYDAEWRLLREVDTDTAKVVASFAYDAKGNMIDDQGVPVSLGPMDNPIQRGPTTIAYDRRGNMLRLPGPEAPLECAWAQDGTLREIRTGGHTYRYEYDALARRTLKTDGTATWRYGWTGAQLLWEEYQEHPGAETIRRDYLYAPHAFQPLAFREQGRTYWLQADARGAIIRAFDEAGSVVWRATYDSFGQAQVETDDVRQPWRLMGQYHDDETGLHYNLARYYSPQMRSYLSLDPLWDYRRTTNYSYARNDPWNLVDPVGALVFLAAIGIVAVGAVVGGLINVASDVVDGKKPSLRSFGEGALGGAVGSLGVVAAACLGPGLVALGVGIALKVAGDAAGAMVEYAVKERPPGRPFCVDCMFAAGGAAAATSLAFGKLGKLLGKVGGKLIKKVAPRIGRWFGGKEFPLEAPTAVIKKGKGKGQFLSNDSAFDIIGRGKSKAKLRRTLGTDGAKSVPQASVSDRLEDKAAKSLEGTRAAGTSSPQRTPMIGPAPSALPPAAGSSDRPLTPQQQKAWDDYISSPDRPRPSSVPEIRAPAMGPAPPSVAARPAASGATSPEQNRRISDNASTVAGDYRARGVTYQMGGSAANGGQTSDCSHYVHDVMNQSGVNVPYVTTGQIGTHPNYQNVSASEARAGDVIVQGGHMGIYTGRQDDRGRPVGTQMGTSGARDAPWGEGGWFAQPGDTRYYRPVP